MAGTRRRAAVITCVVGLCAGAASAVAPAARSAEFGPCSPPAAAGVTCAIVTVPLDRSGGVPGTIDLAVRRKAATSGTATGALVHLPGGPGSAVIRSLERLAARFAPALATRDLIVFDPRGTGLSSPLSCPEPTGNQNDARDCANALGSRRAFFRTRDFADDLEAVRAVAGVDRIAVSAVSYGGVVAYDYVTRYPAHVEWLMLDSPIEPRGFDPLQRESVAATTALLRRLCVPVRRCRGIARSPHADMATLSSRARGKPLRVPYANSRGRRLIATFDPGRLFWLTRDTDSNPALRAQLPAALRAGTAGDLASLGQVGAMVDGVGRRARTTTGQNSAGGGNHAANTATVCEETALPWAIESAPDASARIEAITDASRRLSAPAYGPFDRVGVLFALGTPGRQCLTWPHSGRAAALDVAPAPDVPVLVLAGEDDLRAPVAVARAIAGRFRRAALVIGGNTGHGVFAGGSLTTAMTACLRGVLERFSAGAIAGATCRAARYPPAPFVPATLARVPAESGLGGLEGRTLRAVRLTARSTRYSLVAAVIAAGSLSVDFGGLRGGRVTAKHPAFTMKNVVVVPGIVVSGTLKVSNGPKGALVEKGSLRVSGRGARGTVTLDGDRARGVLGGRRFAVRGASLTPGT